MPQHWQTALFERFKAIYDNKFTDKYSTIAELDAAQKEWGEALVDLTGNEIKRGIESCRDTKAWPPSIAEFKELAKGGVEDWEHGGPAYKEFQAALPKPVNRELGREALTKLKTKVRAI